MIRFFITSCVVLFGLVACSTPTPSQETLPEGSDVRTFTYEREIMQRELRITGAQRRTIPARIYNNTYTIACLNGVDGRSAQSRYRQAIGLIDSEMPRFVEGSTRSNPFYQSGWQTRTNRLIVEPTGCETTNVTWETVTVGLRESMGWVIENGLTLDLLQYSRGRN
jgi:hypothetical protein